MNESFDSDFQSKKTKKRNKKSKKKRTVTFFDTQKQNFFPQSNEGGSIPNVKVGKPCLSEKTKYVDTVGKPISHMPQRFEKQSFGRDVSKKEMAFLQANTGRACPRPQQGVQFEILKEPNVPQRRNSPPLVVEQNSDISDSDSDYENDHIDDTPTRIIYLNAEIRMIFLGNAGLEARRNCLYKTDYDHHVRMLVDSGCGRTTISKEFYDKIKFGIIGDTFAASNMALESCSGEILKTIGHTHVRMWLADDNFYDIKVLIADGIQHDFVLGADFLYGKHIRTHTKRSLIMKRKHDNGLYIKYPLDVYAGREMTAQNNQATVIEPFTTTLLNISVKGKSLSDKNVRFTVNKRSLIRNLKLLPTVYEGNLKTGNFILPVYNDSMIPLFLENGQFISDILKIKNETIIPSVIEINSMSIFSSNENFDDPPIVPLNSVLLDGFRHIEKSQVLTRDEKSQAKSKLEIEGYFKPALTDYLSEKSAITELGLEDTKPLSSEEFLDQFDLKHLNVKRQQAAKKMFLKNIKAFSMSKYDIGVTNLIEMEIPITNTAPRMQKYAAIPMHAKEKVREILDQLEKFDIIRKCNEPSPYCSNILVVKKRDKNEIRLLFDGRLLNYDTQRLPMSTVSKPEILAHLVGKKHLTSLDLKDAFFHIPLDQKSQPLTAFYSSVHGQRFCFKRAPQGLRNSPLYLKLLLDKVFFDMSDDVILFFDDLLIATDGNLEHHMAIVDKVLKKIIQAGLKLGPKKLCLAKEHIEFLGMVFHKGRISIPEAKLEAFKKLPSPNSPKKAKSVICALSFYRHFCPNFAELSHDILALGNVNAKLFKWTAELENKYKLLISTICENAALYLPDPSKKIYVQSDASLNCAGGRVFQKDKDGNEMLIAAVSRTFTKTERAYSIFKKEILSLLYVLKSMDYFLRFSDDLTILVDAKSIIYLRLAKESSGILLRFSLELSKYNCELFHVSGDENIISDILSRHNSEIDLILLDEQGTKPMSEKESIKLVNKLTLPENLHLSSLEMYNLLNGQSPATTLITAVKKSSAKAGTRVIRNTPQTLVNKKLNLPRCSMKRPGVVLPKRLKKQPENKSNFLNSKANFSKLPHNNLVKKSAMKEPKVLTKPLPQNETYYMPKTVLNVLSETENEIDDMPPLEPPTPEPQITESLQVPPPTATFEIPRIEPRVTRSRTHSLPPSNRSQDFVYGLPEVTRNLPPRASNFDTGIETDISTQNVEPQNLNENLNTQLSTQNLNSQNSEPSLNRTDSRSQPSQPDNTGNAAIPDNWSFNDEGDIEYTGNSPDGGPDPSGDPSDDPGDEDGPMDPNEPIDEPPNFISYKDVGTLTCVVKNGLLTLEQFKKAQLEDEYCAMIFDDINSYKKEFVIIQGILFRKIRENFKPVLPIVLINLIVQLKHFSIFGAHMSPTRINRDIVKDFFIPKNELFAVMKEVKKSCYLCQLYDNTIENQKFSGMSKVNSPRVSWSIDIVPNMPTSSNNYSQLLLAVDDYSSFVVTIPMRDSTSKSIIEGLKNHIIGPFGVPQQIRSDEQSSFYSSNEFYKFMSELKIKHQSTSVAAPFSNGRAESQIGNIKRLARKFFFQENCLNLWDQFLPILTNSHNTSVGVYGYTAEEIMFGTRIQKPVDLLVFDYMSNDPEDYIDFIFEKTEKLRNESILKKDARNRENRTFKNLNRIQKKFDPGTLVLHRQLQVSTGKHSGYKPLFTGPFVVLSCNDKESFAIVEHLHNGNIIKGHYNNLHMLNFKPDKMTYKKDCTNDLIMDFNKMTSKEIQKRSNTPHPNLI